MGELERFCYFYFIHQSKRWPLTELAFGDNPAGFTFTNFSALKKGKIRELDEIFDKVECLVDDYHVNLKQGASSPF